MWSLKTPNRLAFPLLSGTVTPTSAGPPIVADSERTGEPSRGRVGWHIFLNNKLFFVVLFGFYNTFFRSFVEQGVYLDLT